MGFPFSRTLLAITTCVLASGYVLGATEAERAGVTLLAKGSVTASNSEGERDLERRSPVFESDTLTTGDDSRAQFRMKDGATLALQANTKLTLAEYRYDEEGKSDSAVMKMVTGGLRTITGAVGKGDPDAYRLETPLATIGVRGTVFEAELVGKELFVAFWQGYGKVTTPTCEVYLGDGQPHRFVRILESTECDFIDLEAGIGVDGAPRPDAGGALAGIRTSPFAAGHSSDLGGTGGRQPTSEDRLSLGTFGLTSGDPDFSTGDELLAPGSLSIDIVFPE